MKKRSLYILGLITLIAFPIPTFVGLYLFEGITPKVILQSEMLGWKETGIGLLVGGLYGLFALQLMKAKVFDSLPNRIEKIVEGMRLNLIDCLFISLCAGLGEEFLFRSGVQYYLGPLITSVIFVAIHGYLNPFNWKLSLYGVIVLPFILIISYGLPYFGIWFCIAAHACYDFVLFTVMSKPSEPQYEDELSAEQAYIEEEL